MNTQLTEAHKEQILDQLYITHEHAARRNNTSTQVVVAAFESNGGDLLKSISAGLMCLGGAHAPIKQVYQLFDQLSLNGNIILGGKIPGFGSSFVKNNHDPMLENLRMVISDLLPQYIEWGKEIRSVLRKEGKNLYPNLAFYTAAVSHGLGETVEFCQQHLVRARVNAWIQILEQTYGPTKTTTSSSRRTG